LNNKGNKFNINNGEVKFQKNILARRLPEIKDIPQRQRLSFLGKGSLIGDEDVYLRENYSCTCICNTAEGHLYELSKDEFIKLKSSENSWLAIMERIIQKEMKQQATDMKAEPRNFDKEIKEQELERERISQRD